MSKKKMIVVLSCFASIIGEPCDACELTRGSCRRVYFCNTLDVAQPIAIGPRHLVFADYEKTSSDRVTILTGDDFSTKQSREFPCDIQSLAVSHDSKFVAIGGADGRLRILRSDDWSSIVSVFQMLDDRGRCQIPGVRFRTHPRQGHYLVAHTFGTEATPVVRVWHLADSRLVASAVASSLVIDADFDLRRKQVVWSEPNRIVRFSRMTGEVFVAESSFAPFTLSNSCNELLSWSVANPYHDENEVQVLLRNSVTGHRLAKWSVKQQDLAAPPALSADGSKVAILRVSGRGDVYDMAGNCLFYFQADTTFRFGEATVRVYDEKVLIAAPFGEKRLGVWLVTRIRNGEENQQREKDKSN